VGFSETTQYITNSQSVSADGKTFIIHTRISNNASQPVLKCFLMTN